MNRTCFLSLALLIPLVPLLLNSSFLLLLITASFFSSVFRKCLVSEYRTNGPFIRPGGREVAGRGFLHCCFWGGNVRESMSGRQCQGVNIREAISGSQCQGGNVKEAMSGRFILRVYTIRNIITYKLRLARETMLP